jgi:uncharacterized membrane protein
MNILRRITVGIAWTFLPVMLFSFGLLLSVWLVLSNADTVKSSLATGGVYKSETTSLLRAVAPATPLTSSNDISTDNPAVTAALEKAFPPQLIEKQSNIAIDDTYSWIKGNTAQLNFALDFSDAKNNFATYLSGAARDRVNALPNCTVSRTLTLDIDPFTATCRPFGITGDMAAAKISTEVARSNLFNDAKLTAGEITNDGGKNLSEQLEATPSIYKNFRRALIASGILMVILATVVVWWGSSRRRGAKRVGILLITGGASSAIIAYGAGFAADKLVRSIAGDSGDVQDALVKTTGILIHDIKKWWFIYSIVLLLVGIGLTIWLRMTQPPKALDPTATPETPQPPLAQNQL